MHIHQIRSTHHASTTRRGGDDDDDLLAYKLQKADITCIVVPVVTVMNKYGPQIPQSCESLKDPPQKCVFIIIN